MLNKLQLQLQNAITLFLRHLIYPVWSSYYVRFKNRSNKLPYGDV